MSYRYLVLPPEADAIRSPAARKKIKALADKGVQVIGPGMREGALEAVVRTDGLLPDIEFRDASNKTPFQWIHRREGPTDIYFISNQDATNVAVTVVFRVADKQPELWDAVTGEIRDLPKWHSEKPRSVVPLRFAPRQSLFIVFRKPSKDEDRESAGPNFADLKDVKALDAPWEVSFDPKWGGPEKVTFKELADWTKRPEDGIRYYFGTATYKKTLDAPTGSRLFLDLGVVKNLARVRLNGRDLGVVWTAPWQVEITDVVKAKGNQLEIDVVNTWPNRLIGDGLLPEEKRHTTTNISTYDAKLRKMNWNDKGTYWAQGKCKSCQHRLRTGGPCELFPSGLIGPVTVRKGE
jgi:hypothetical protein